MTLTFFTNFVHHHQIPVADEFYRVLGDNYKYVAMRELPEWLIKGGYDSSIKRPYVIRAYESETALQEVKKLMLESDVVIVSYAPNKELIERKKQNKITFHYSERWLKHKWSIIDPRLLYRVFTHHLPFRKKRTYMLCASAFTASDVHKFFCYPQKTFKWGYMTRVDNFDIETSFISKREKVSIMWCARFLALKHPEMVVKLAKWLKDEHYNFIIDMFGSGVELERTKTLANLLGVEDVVSFRGNMSNAEILNEMRNHDIFLFTSDRNEGWGAVTNESMSNGCVIVGSDEIGSIPFLVQDGENGLIFHSKNMESLISKVEWLINNPNEMHRLSQNAYKTMYDLWSPTNAVKSFLELVEYVRTNSLYQYNKEIGPASWAY